MPEPTPFHALVTGATGGIGQGICLALIAQAARDRRALTLTVTASRTGDKLDTLAAQLRAHGITVHALGGDVTDPARCRSLVEEAVALGGDLSALVCVAGATTPGPLSEMSVDQWDRSFHLNTRSVWLMAQAARPSLMRTRGSITAIASMTGLQPIPGMGAYSPAKAALAMLCRQLAQEWGPDGIRTNSVCPGMIRTPLSEAVYQDDDTRTRREALVPVGRIGRPDDIGHAVAYLVSEGASYVNGVNLLVDGGVSDHMMAMIPGRPGKAAPPRD